MRPNDATRPKFPALSVFFPAFNDAPSLPHLVGTTFSVLREYVEDYEVIVVDDGSRDRTADVLRELQAEHGPKLRIVTHRENRGYGGALRSGFEAANLEYVFYTDGDGQYDVRELPSLLAVAGPKIGLVNGWKLKRHDPWLRIWIGRVYNAAVRFLFQIKIQDIDCDYRLIRTALVKDVGLTSTSGTICVELVKKIELTGCGVAQVGVRHLPRQYGRSQFFRVRSLLTTFVQLVRLYGELVIVRGICGSSPRALASR